MREGRNHAIQISKICILFYILFQCYMFHMYVGVRAGGGIGDEIEDPAGDEFEVERIVFDITFFFFVIVILLAIIQGESYNTTLFVKLH